MTSRNYKQKILTLQKCISISTERLVGTLLYAHNGSKASVDVEVSPTGSIAHLLPTRFIDERLMHGMFHISCRYTSEFFMNFFQLYLELHAVEFTSETVFLLESQTRQSI